MGLQRAAVLYPVNTTTVDTGTGINVRLLDSAQAGANDDTQSIGAAHTNDNAEGTYTPAGSAVLGNNANTTLNKTGWALRLAEDCTPSDDANCNAALNAGTLTVNLQVTADKVGGTYIAGSYGPTWKASLWRYNLSANTGTLIAAGSDATPTWDHTPITGDLGTYKAVAISIAVPSEVEFLQGEILLLQVGLNTGTIPDPVLGTTDWYYYLRVDNAETNITWAANQSIIQICRIARLASMVGVATRLLETQPLKTVILAGTASISRFVRVIKAVSLAGVASVQKYLRLGTPLLATMAGVVSVFKTAKPTAKLVTLTGIATKGQLTVTAFKNVVMTGIAAKGQLTVTAFKNVVMTGVAVGVRQLIAARAFQVAMTGVPALYVKVKQDILNRLSGGGQTIIKWFGIED